MARAVRKEVIDETAVGIFYSASIALRGERFCAGKDAGSGRNFEHRTAWVRERLAVRAGVFFLWVECSALSKTVEQDGGVTR